MFDSQHKQIMAGIGQIQQTLASLTRKVNTIMSQDAAIEAVVGDEETQLANITDALSSIKAVVDQLVLDVQNGTASVSAQTMQDLQAAQVQLDNLAAGATSQAAAEAAEAAAAEPVPVPPADAPPADVPPATA